MALTLELTKEQAAKLERQARVVGIKPAEYVLRLIDDLPEPPKGLLPGESVLDAAKRLGAAGVVQGTPRADGRAWSEVEGFD